MQKKNCQLKNALSISGGSVEILLYLELLDTFHQKNNLFKILRNFVQSVIHIKQNIFY